MFLQATFFTTAGNRSEAFFPRAIICVLGSKRKIKGEGGGALIRVKPDAYSGSLLWDSQARHPWEAPLTATILFMASSLRESLLVSNISLRSSCLVGGTEGQIRNRVGHESPVSRQDSGQVQSKEGPEPGDTGGEWKWVSSRLGVQERLVGQPLL